MPTGMRRIGRPLSRVQTGLLKKPIRRANEDPMAWYKRYKRWMDITERHEKRETLLEWKESQKTKSKPKPKATKPGRKLTEREGIIKARKEAEKLLGVKRGVKKKPKKKKKK